jgi:hypothetical protein
MKKAVVNYMLLSEEMSLFLESNSTEEIAHTAQFTIEDMSQVINKTSSGLIAGASMDITSVNKASWIMLKAAYPDMFPRLCSPRTAHSSQEHLRCNKGKAWSRVS